MGRTWNPLWNELWDESAPADYAAAIRRLILASVDWIEAHPNAELNWQERDVKHLAEMAGVLEGVDIQKVGFIGSWSDFVRPSNEATDEWFKAIVGACENGMGEVAEPSIMMMQKGMAAGLMVNRDGWDAFDLFMTRPRNGETRMN